MHFAKRMRSRKEAMPEIDLPLSFKNGLDALSLWTLNTQVKADKAMVSRAQHRVDCARPVVFTRALTLTLTLILTPNSTR